MTAGVVGCGFVGDTAAYAMVMDGVGRQIVLVDLARQRAEAEVNDIMHAVPISFNEEETAAFHASADIVRNATDSLKL